jgi:lipoate-protein ligase A
VDALIFEDEAKREEARAGLNDRATTVAQILGQYIGWQDMAERMVLGFEDALQITLQPGKLSLEEKQRAFILLKEKYANRHWTERL